jgi:nicotinamide-nucleotide amidase
MSELPNDEKLTRLAERIGDCLRAGGHTITAAESCTGGWVAKCLTDVAGSSDWFECALVTYSDRAKQEHLEVRGETLALDGAVSESTVREMAVGALGYARADISVAVSGIAGPGGGSPEKPLGLVWFAWAGAHGVQADQQQFSGDREAIRRQAVAHALDGVLRFCEAPE